MKRTSAGWMIWFIRAIGISTFGAKVIARLSEVDVCGTVVASAFVSSLTVVIEYRK